MMIPYPKENIYKVKYMQFYDLHVHTDSLEETVKIAKLLGIAGIGLSINWTNREDLESFRKQIAPFKDIDIAIGVEINEKPANISKLAKQLRKDVELILVHGGDLEVNRAAVETPEVDILLHPENKEQGQESRYDSGLDHVMVKLAKKNNVHIEFSLNDVIYTSKKTRASILKSLLQNTKLVRKYNAPFVITSGAWSAWNMRAASDLLSFGKYLGFQDPEIKKALSAAPLVENKKRLSGKWVAPGVEIV